MGTLKSRPACGIGQLQEVFAGEPQQPREDQQYL